MCNVSTIWTRWRIVLISSVVCLFVGVIGGYFLTPTKIQVVEKVVEKKTTISDKTVVKREIKRPDGTIETETIQKDVTSKENTIDKNVAKDETTTISAASDVYRPKYSIGAHAQVGTNTTMTHSYNMTIGYRLLGNLWGEALFNTGHKEIAVGLRIEF